VPRIFISFSGESGRSVARELYELLHAMPGIQVWMAPDRIQPGRVWFEQLARELHATDGRFCA